MSQLCFEELYNDCVLALVGFVGRHPIESFRLLTNIPMLLFTGNICLGVLFLSSYGLNTLCFIPEYSEGLSFTLPSKIEADNGEPNYDDSLFTLLSNALLIFFYFRMANKLLFGILVTCSFLPTPVKVLVMTVRGAGLRLSSLSYTPVRVELLGRQDSNPLTYLDIILLPTTGVIDSRR